MQASRGTLRSDREFSRAPCKGFTLVELLVVIAIIGMLVALLLPAVQAARDAARRIQCSNNLKQLALACQAHHDAKQALPPGVLSKKSGPQAADGNFQTGWCVEVLPFIEQNTLYDQYIRENGGAFNPLNQQVVQTIISGFMCPSDATIEALRAPVSSDLRFAASSYKGVAGAFHTDEQGKRIWWDVENWEKLPDNYHTRGPLHVVDPEGQVKAARFGEFSDGLSNTLLIGEYMTPDIPNVSYNSDFRRPAWGASFRNFNLSLGFVEGAARIPDFDLCSNAMGATGAIYLCKRAFGSFHGGGVLNFARCDGGVATIAPEIDGNIFRSMCTIAGEELLPSGL